jgi:2-polyprenyl-6-hydroxyphenyl methylase/3-demethylubiquinone-9 3-methyltransferase
MNHDRIAEVYDGTYGTPETQQLARTRIHWMCSNARGEQILDIGCSQGIASLLLGREGRRVIGVDREAAAIAHANDRLEREEPAVRERVRFEVAEGAALGLPDESVDTVLLGEVIEHLVDPKPVLAEARRVLRTDGTLVLTTPYGLFPYHDHKEPLYLRDVLGLLHSHFAVDRVELLHHYLALVCLPAGKRMVKKEMILRALELAELRLAAQDRQVAKLRARLASERRPAADHELSERVRSLSAELERRVDERAAEGAELERARADRVRLQAELRTTLELVERLRRDQTELERDLERAETTVQSLFDQTAELDAARAEIAALRAELGVSEAVIESLQDLRGAAPTSSP